MIKAIILAILFIFSTGISPEPTHKTMNSGALNTDGSCDLPWSYCWKTA